MEAVAEQTKDKKRAAYVEGMYGVADLLYTRPDLPLPSGISDEESEGTSHHAYVFGLQFEGESDRERLADAARKLAQSGKVLKGSDNHWYWVELQFGDWAYRVLASRQNVCERVVVGTERVEIQKEVRPAETETAYVDREVVEWRCPESLLAPEGEDG